MSIQDVSFEATEEERAKVRKIAARSRQLYLNSDVERDQQDIEMDLIATHANGCPLDFDKLAAFDDFSLFHDVVGIARHLDRDTGKLGDFFDPRCSKPMTDEA